MHINATLINLYHVCKRECWLHANDIRMEQTSDIVYDGKLLHETSYPQRSDRYTEIELSATFTTITLTGKIDFYDAREKIIHETKRSDKVEDAHLWQVKYYIWLLSLNDIEGVHGLLEYPSLRRTDEVWLSAIDRQFLEQVTQDITKLVKSETCPPVINAKICTSCSYYEFCYIAEP